MPEGAPSLPGLRCSALDEFARETAAPAQGRRASPIRIKADHLRRRRSRADHAQPVPTSDDNGRGTKRRAKAELLPPPPSRKTGSSIYYGVRFRPDLNKWVAEIRVAEWKAVDKKVWLGTFDTEEGAARGVDLARKLLRCQKKHSYNLPCAQLDAYAGHIPAQIVLSDVTATSMFKAATLFIKHECQEYAASFLDSPAPPTTSLDSEIVDQVWTENSDLYDTGDSISIDDYLNVALDQSPSSCTSTTSCMTFLDAGDQVPSGLVADFGSVFPGGVQGAVCQDECWAGDQLPGSYAPHMFHVDDTLMDCDDIMSFQTFHYPLQQETFFQPSFNYKWC